MQIFSNIFVVGIILHFAIHCSVCSFFGIDILLLLVVVVLFTYFISCSLTPDPLYNPFPFPSCLSPLSLSPAWNIKSLQGWANPLLLRPDKEVQLEEHIPRTGNSFWVDPITVVQDPHEDQAAFLL